MFVEPNDVDLSGLIDMHIHTSPDASIRSMDDLQAARQAAEAGMAAIVLKSHITITSDRAAIAQSVVQGINIFGGVVLNDEVGGINPKAVEAAFKLGAKVIWMPTFSANNHNPKPPGRESGINILTQIGDLLPEVYDVLDLIRENDAILATCHLSIPEIIKLVHEATSTGVRNIVITHPEAPFLDMPVNIQCKLREKGVYFERCFVSTFPIGGGVPLSKIETDILEVGYESTILSTDFGVASLPPAVIGMKEFISVLMARGFTRHQINQMVRENPAKLLGL